MNDIGEKIGIATVMLLGLVIGRALPGAHVYAWIAPYVLYVAYQFGRELWSDWRDTQQRRRMIGAKEAFEARLRGEKMNGEFIDADGRDSRKRK